MKRERWEQIQAGEFDYHAGKDESRILDCNLPYWRALLAELPEEVRFGPDRRVMDIGCGGCGILLALDQGTLVGVDPLMDRYLEKFPFLAQRKEIRWINSTAEEADVEGPFHVIFSINSFDHVYDARSVIRRMRELLEPGGHVVLTMNCHNTRFFRTYYRSLYRVIDHHHPYQFTPDDVVDMFEGFTPVLRRSIDDVWFPHAEKYYRAVLKRPFVDKRKWLRAAMNPFKWPMGLCKVAFDMPPHKKRPGQRSIYDNVLFVMRRDPDA